MAEAVAGTLRERRRAARRSRHRHRQDARVSRSCHSQRPARARLDRHEESPGADLLQGPRGSSRGARRAVHRHLHEGPRQLSLPAPVRIVSRRREERHAPAVRRIGGADLSADHRRMVEADRDRRPRRDGGPARGPPVLGRDRRDIRKLHRHRVPALHRLLRHAHALARGRVESGRREPPPALRRRRRPAERIRRGHSGVQLRDRRRSASAGRRRDAVFRRVGEQLPVRRAGARWRAR